MSFTSIVKNEVSKLDTIETENITELSALIRNIGTITKDGIKIVTENSSVARRIFGLLKDTYGVISKITVRKGYNYNKNYIYMLDITQKKDMILTDLSLLENHTYLSIPKEYILDDMDLKKAYLRGFFLAIGSVNDPKKSRYHLEFLVDKKDYADFICQLLNSFILNARYIKRDHKFMIYLKEAEKIGDFLRLIQANNAILYYENIRIYRDHKNMTNRLNNCEQANVDKMIMAATSQIREIEQLEEAGIYDLLDEKIKEVAWYRKKYPDASLLELSEIISIETGSPITKSGLHHRLKKIHNMVENLNKK